MVLEITFLDSGFFSLYYGTVFSVEIRGNDMVYILYYNFSILQQKNFVFTLFESQRCYLTENTHMKIEKKCPPPSWWTKDSNP